MIGLAPQDEARAKAILTATRDALDVLRDGELAPDEMLTAACFLVGSLIVGAHKTCGADPITLLAVSHKAIRDAARIEGHA